jgi:hypothetical protein
VQDGDHPGEGLETVAVQVEEAAAFDRGREVFFVGVAEREEDGIGVCLGGQAAGDEGAQGAVMGCEEAMRDVVTPGKSLQRRFSCGAG